jgi:aspartate kinase
MALICRKYGGSSVATIEKISAVAEQIKTLYLEGHQIVCVVSAMGSTTDELLLQASKISSQPQARELDMLLSIGERKSISLMALALAAIDVNAVSFTGSQIGIITDNQHGNAKILEIKTDRLKAALAENKVVVVAGFQGVSVNKEITTLGRGGTDTTAVALAAALGADRCELMKDVDGLFQVPPNLINDCHLRKEVSHSDMLAIANAGAELVAAPALELAQAEKITLGIGNTKTNYISTIVLEKTLHEKKKAQLVICGCHFSFVAKVSSDEQYLRRFAINDKNLSIDLNPDHSEKNGLFVTLFYTEQHLIEKLLQKKPIFLSQVKNETHFLFKKEEENDLKPILKDIARAL